MKQLTNILFRLLGKGLDEKVKQYFVSGAYKTLLLQAAITIITFLTALLIARVTGDKGFGVYTTVFTWVSIISVGATLGLDDLLLKLLPFYKQKKQEKHISGLLYWTNVRGIVFGLICAVILLLFAHFSSINGLYQYADYYSWAVWTIPFFVVMHVNQAALRGVKQLGKGQLAEKFVQPIAFFLLLVIIYGLQSSLTDEHAIAARTISFLIAAIVALYLLWYNMQPYLKAEEPVYAPKIWWQSCKYFALTSLLYMFNTRMDIVFLSLYDIAEEDIAYYNAAQKLSDLALIPFAILYTVTMPMFAELFAQDKKKELQAFFTKTARIAFFLIMIILVFLVLLGKWLLGWFGTSFVVGYDLLLIFCVTKFIHIFVGPVNYLMMVTNLEKEATWALVVSVMVTIGLNIYWIPLYESNGAAYASLVGLLVFELLVSWITYRKSGIVPTIIGDVNSEH